MKLPDKNLLPDWDEDNVSHIARHGLSPEQVEEVYYSEGPFPTVALRKKRPHGKEIRYRIWGTDAAGSFIETVVAIFPAYGVWRCVSAYEMSATTKKAYLKRVKR